jgi:SAM-dependent methyltransferase
VRPALRSGRTLDRHAQDWEDLAIVDPYWSILSDEHKRFGRWDHDEFFRSGAVEIDAMMGRAERLGHPTGRHAALDFGCGIGRLTRALASHFDQSVGVDISETMIEVARQANADVANCSFVLNRLGDLRLFQDGQFDFVYTRNVLHHLVSSDLILFTISELVRTLAPGGLLAFQATTFIPRRHRLQPRRRVYRGLRRFSISPRFLYNTLRLQPIRMTPVHEADVKRRLAWVGARMLEVDREVWEGGTESATYHVTK